MIDDGGPAFPHAAWEFTGSGGETALTHHSGAVTLRDYFAATAMQGLLANPTYLHAGEGWSSQVLADDAFGVADAMLKERAK